MSQTILGFDPGNRKIGIATGSLLTGVAAPLETWCVEVEAWEDASFWRKISTLIETWRPVQLVVGVAYTADGKPAPQQLRSERFAKLLESETALPVSLVDERLSSHEAQHRLNQMSKKQQKVGLDAVAAAIIIETYLGG